MAVSTITPPATPRAPPGWVAKSLVGAVLVFRNVTEDYALQQALNDSAALVQTVLNSVADGVITLHARGGAIERLNPAAEQMFGYAGAKLSGQPFSLLIPELDQDQLMRALMDAASRRVEE